MLHFFGLLHRNQLGVQPALRSVIYSAVVLIALAVAAESRKPHQAIEKPLIPPQIARFEIVLGRLQLSTEFFRIGAAHEQVVLEDGRQRIRSLSVSILRGKPTLQFRDHGGDEEVELSFKADHHVDIKMSSGIDGVRHKITYHQPAEGPITLGIEFSDGRAPLEFESRSLWHMAIAQPSVVDDYLQPLLRRLDGNWDIALTASEVQQLISNQVQPGTTQVVKQLIKQLDAVSAAQRHAATLELTALGLAAEFPLRDSLATDLSNHQQTVICKLLEDCHPTGNDTAMRIAVWMSGESN